MTDHITMSPAIPAGERLRGQAPQHLLRRHGVGETAFLVEEQPAVEEGGLAEHRLGLG